VPCHRRASATICPPGPASEGKVGGERGTGFNAEGAEDAEERGAADEGRAGLDVTGD